MHTIGLQTYKKNTGAVMDLKNRARPGSIGLFVAVLCAFGLAGCDFRSAVAGSAQAEPALEVLVLDTTGTAIVGADVNVTIGGLQYHATTSAVGVAEFASLPAGQLTLSISAAGFESIGINISPEGRSELWQFTLRATEAWSAGRAIVLGTSLVDLASNGSAMTFSIDIAVINENSESLETLTADDFKIVTFECGWGGPRDCASDAAGNATGFFTSDGGARLFGLQAASARRPYLVGVLAERSTAVSDWQERVPALKAFFAALGGNDFASLASMQESGGISTLTELGPFTSDGRSYLDAIEQLAAPAGDTPAVLDSLLETIRRTAEATNAIPGVEPSVLILAMPWMSVADIDSATALARESGVRISTVGYTNYGFPEMAVRTGGLVAEIDDPRQLGMVFGAMDNLLAGTTSFYRMQFRIVGQGGTFVSGGNAKVWLRIDVPTSFPFNGVYTNLDVAIP